MQLSELIKKDPVIERVAKAEEVIWFNPGLRCRDAAFEGISLTMADIDDAEARLRRFAPFIMRCFPETAGNGGIIESPLTEVEHMRQRLNGHGGGIGGRLLLKRDSDLAIAGSVKARGGIYEILKTQRRSPSKRAFSVDMTTTMRSWPATSAAGCFRSTPCRWAPPATLAFP